MTKQSAYNAPAVKDETTADEIFYQIESEYPDEVKDIMFEGRSFTPHNSWLND